MKKLFLLIIICLLIGCERSEPSHNGTNVHDCLITTIENTILENKLSYGDVIYGFYHGRGLYFTLYDLDNDYLNPYNPDVANVLENRDKLEKLLESKLNIDLKYNGYYTTSLLRSLHHSSEVLYFHRFYYEKWNDEVVVCTNPNTQEGFISVKIICSHEHYIKRLVKQ